MIKAHVQIPDELHLKAKALAEAREWSFAEVVRRGLEYMTRTQAENVETHWELPLLPAGKSGSTVSSRDIEKARESMWSEQTDDRI